MEFIFIYVACPQVRVCPRHGLSIGRIGSGGILFIGGCRRMCHGVMLCRGVKLYLCGRCPARLAFTYPAGLCRRNVCYVCVRILRQCLVCCIVRSGLNYHAM